MHDSKKLVENTEKTGIVTPFLDLHVVYDPTFGNSRKARKTLTTSALPAIVNRSGRRSRLHSFLLLIKRDIQYRSEIGLTVSLSGYSR